jgi:dTDP-4-amino-4,6-dideoxygalactose transaminase
MVDLAPGLRELRADIDAALARVIDSGLFVNGPEVRALERELAGYLGVAECVGLNSGTDALVLGLRALGVGPGHEVIVPAFSFFASAEAVSAVGAQPVFADVDPRSFNLDPAAAARAITRRTRALLPVHLFGQAAAMDRLAQLAEQHGLLLLEDAAQALGGSHRGCKLGSLGHAAALSFFPSKNLGAFGDAGVLATNSTEVAEACRQLRQHGSRSSTGRGRHEHERIGHNSRLDSLQAAVLRVKLPRLDRALAARQRAAERYDALLADLPGLVRPWRDPDAAHTFHQYTVRLPATERDRVAEQLAAQGIQTMVYYPTPLHRAPAYRAAHLGLELPEAEAASRCVLSLPIWPEIEPHTQRRVADALRAALANEPARAVS